MYFLHYIEDSKIYNQKFIIKN
ncbi:hypothetical protein [Soonwooa sp.]